MSFTRTEAAAGNISFEFEGRTLKAAEGESLAGALLLAGISTFRSTVKSGASRGPYCMMGVCFECLVEVDGRPNQQACMIEVRDGMSVKRQQGAPEVAQ